MEKPFAVLPIKSIVLEKMDDQDEEVLGLKRRLVDYEGSNYGGDSEISWLGREKDVVGSLNRLVAMPESDDRCHGYGGFDNKARGDVKKRLGPIQKDPISVSFRGRLEPSNKVFLKRKKKDSLRKTTDNNINGSLDKVVKPSKTVVSEDSDEFHRLVEKAFFKFIKNLHEHPAQRRKYLDQEGESTLKCCVCGSSKEFLCPLELVKHALTSHKRELRAEHLGFHKALCVLLGWNSATAPNTPWVLQILPRAEATALREDLIIWPPVVIIQNISIANRNLDERVIVSIQMYEAILRDMGFNGEKTKVFRGKAANQSILVAIFNATLSGLQEAERLHKHYAENKHGRLELQQTNSTDHNNTHRDTRELTESEKLESVLYGYLGIVEDLDKLDFNIKSHCVVRSKKEIQAISDATL
uniref:XS domain-containing protein n=1 Tax=Cannabis sativa TaxID=3483 RepID=A0A803Q0Q1_CANSA